MKALAIDLYCGLGGWTEGLIAEGYDVIGFDIERHVYGGHRYPAQLVLQDVRTLHGKQFRDVDLIVASPPCQEYSYMAMPWSRAKAIAAEYRSGVRDVRELTALFDACFRIQREACEATGRHVPLVVENVKGAQPWVGQARAHFGSYYLWGDVPALMPMAARRERKVPGLRFDGSGKSFQSASVAMMDGTGFKSSGLNWSDPTKRGQDFTRVAGRQYINGQKNAGGSWFAVSHNNVPHSRGDGVKQRGSGDEWFDIGIAKLTSKSPARKFASAMIAKIPLPLARHIARYWSPQGAAA